MQYLRSWIHPARLALGVGLSLWGWSLTAQATDWAQFRGPGGGGRATTADPLPAEIGPDRNVLWKTPLPPGHSSPVVVGSRIFLTCVSDDRLLTVALDRATGEILWQADAPHEQLEAIHRVGSLAQSSCAADGERVVSFFGSSGLLCYDHQGQLLWQRRMGPFKNDFGAATSPILEDDWVILCQDHDTDSFLTAIDKRSGETIWQTDRSEFPRNYCSPVIWGQGDQKQIVIAATLRVVGYDFQTGEERWTVRGLSRAVCMTPVVGDDGTLYAAGWSAGGEADDRIRLGPFEDVAPSDANGDEILQEAELEDGPVKTRFTQVDRDKSGGITRQEYDYFRGLFEKSRNVVLAIRPGGQGEATDTHVKWEYGKLVPFCASPLFFEDHVYTVKDGGIFNCLDASAGKPQKQGRLPGTGSYFASPVAGDGKVYLIDDKGELSVVRAGSQWEVISTASFGEDAYATPALVDGRIYLRTAGHLYCFGAPPGT